MAASVASITIYPIKSTAGLAVDSAAVEGRGLVGDRRYMIVDEAGEFLTARRYPPLLLVRATPIEDGLRLTGPSQAPLEVAGTVGAPMEVGVWCSRVQARRVSDAADAWLSGVLGKPCHLVVMGDDGVRPVSPNHGQPGDEVSFADAYPVLIISQASLDGLNDRLQAPLPMARFRPNIVIAGSGAHAEDNWQRIRVGVAEFELVKLCDRCVLTTIDPETAERDPEQEPLRSLATYRKMGGKVMFGKNAIPRSLGNIHVGDPVTVLDAG